MAAGVVLQPGETAYRQVPLWIRVQQDGTWAGASSADVLVTDLRLLCRFESRPLTSLWWSGIVGLNVDLAAEHIVLDFGDAQPVCLSGPLVAPVAVAGIASVYGTDAILTHHALALLRTRGSSAARRSASQNHASVPFVTRLRQRTDLRILLFQKGSAVTSARTSTPLPAEPVTRRLARSSMAAFRSTPT